MYAGRWFLSMAAVLVLLLTDSHCYTTTLVMTGTAKSSTGSISNATEASSTTSTTTEGTTTTTETTTTTTPATETTVTDTTTGTDTTSVFDTTSIATSAPEFSGPHYVYNVSNNSLGACTDFYFTCRIDHVRPTTDDGAMFDVALMFDGQLDTNIKTTTSQQPEVNFMSAQFNGRFGTQVSCAVRSYSVFNSSIQESFVPSRTSYFVGIKYWTEGGAENSGVQMVERAVYLPVYFQATVPIACSQCSVTFQLSRHTGLTVSSCSVTFSSLDPPGAVQVINIRAVQTPGTFSRVFRMEFYNATTSCNDSSLNGYRLKSIPVLIRDEITAVSCVSDGDPHIRTFDYAFYSIYTEGDFLLWRSTSNISAEVHARFQHCFGLNTVSCNCAVAFREGNNIVGVYACDPSQAPIAIQYLRDPHTSPPRVQIGNDGLYFYITMPSGRAMSVSTVCPYCGRLTINLYSISEDVGHAVGLCGNYNGNADDDRMPRGSSVSENADEPIKFARSHMLYTYESFINGHAYYPQCLSNVVAVPTKCQCGEVDAINCRGISAASGALIPAVTYITYGTNWCIRRRKRNAELETYSDFGIFTGNVSNLNGSDAAPTEALHPNISAVNESFAKQLCEDTVFHSRVYSQCAHFTLDVVRGLIDGCILDLQLTDNSSVVVSDLLARYTELCIRTIQEDDSRKFSVAVALFNTLLNHVETAADSFVQSNDNANVESRITKCEDQCMNHGLCNDSQCICEEGWLGPTCRLPANSTPEITQYQLHSRFCIPDDPSPDCSPIICDIRTFNDSCSKAKMFMVEGTYSSSFTTVVCKNVLDNVTYYRSATAIIPASVTNFEFQLPQSPLDTDSTSPIRAWNLSLTNNYMTFSYEIQFIVYDSKCMNCYSSRPTCRQKAGTCLIVGKCYVNEERNPYDRGQYDTDSCYGCLPDTNSSSWTRGWVGASCQQPVSVPPTITQVKIHGTFCLFADCTRTFCDVRENGTDCSSFPIVMDIESYSLPVVFRSVGASAVYYSQLQVEQTSGIQVAFRLPISPLDPESTSANYTWAVSASNDNKTFSNQTLFFFVFDSKCLNCSQSTETCPQKSSTCLVDGKCYDEDERNASNRCYACLPDKGSSTLIRGYVGQSCDQSVTIPPTVTHLQLGSKECSLSSDCTQAITCDVSVLGANCSRVKLGVISDTYSTPVYVRCMTANMTVYVSVSVLTAMRVAFDLPMTPFSNGSTSPNYTWTVSVSNDNEHFGDNMTFVVYDSKCIECLNTTGDCQQKNWTCAIDGKCYVNEDENPKDSSYKCLPEFNISAWTRVMTTTPTTTTTASASSPPSSSPSSSSAMTTSSTTTPTTTLSTTLSTSWAPWTSWSQCGTGCTGDNVVTRTRSCPSAPTCVGADNETLNCVLPKCPLLVEEEVKGCIVNISGVVMDQFADNTFVADLFSSLVDAVNTYISKNRLVNCRRLLPGFNAINPAVESQLIIATLSRVRIARGYPQSNGVNSVTVHLLFWATHSQLSSQCAVGVSHRKRNTDDSIVYLDKHLITDALNDGKSNISQATNTIIGSFVASPDTTSITTIAPSPTTTSSSPTAVIIIASSIGSAVLLLLLISGVIICVKRNKSTTATPTAPMVLRPQAYAPRSYYYNRPPYFIGR